MHSRHRKRVPMVIIRHEVPAQSGEEVEIGLRLWAQLAADRIRRSAVARGREQPTP